MRRLATLTVIGLSLCTLVACKNDRSKGRISRSTKPGEARTSNKGFAQKALKNGKSCFDLPAFNDAAIGEVGTFTVYVQDVDYVERGKDANGCPPFVPTGADVIEARPLASINSVYLKAQSSETLKPTFDFLRVKTQTDCSAIEFAEGPSFEVRCKDQGAGKLSLETSDKSEFRTYSLDDSGLTVVVYKRVAAVPSCAGDKAPNAALYQKIRYKLVASDAVTSVRLQTSYLQALTRGLKKTPKSITATIEGMKGKDGELSLNVMSLLQLVEQARPENVCPNGKATDNSAKATTPQ